MASSTAFTNSVSLPAALSAWTANVDTWAMSRYQDYGFSELVVINGVLYGVAEDGVYRLDAKEHIEGG